MTIGYLAGWAIVLLLLVLPFCWEPICAFIGYVLDGPTRRAVAAREAEQAEQRLITELREKHRTIRSEDHARWQKEFDSLASSLRCPISPSYCRNRSHSHH
jgi:hypothetical protein